MKKSLKTLATAITLCASFTCVGSAFADFVDLPEDTATKEALLNAVSNGLIKGYENDEIKPYNNITRAEMGAILVRAMGATKKEDISGFSDMNSSQWYYDEMSKAVAMGAFKGDGQNLNPEVNITFQEAFVVLSRIFDLPDKVYSSTDDPFSGIYDSDKVADWAKEDVGCILKFGYWNAENGYLRPTEYINRAEFAVLMDNLVGTYVDEIGDDGRVTEFNNGNVVVRVNDAVISGYNQEKNDIYISDGVTGTTTFENANLNRVVARNGDVAYLSGNAHSIRMLTPGLNTFISREAKVAIFDGVGCNVDFGTFTIGE